VLRAGGGDVDRACALHDDVRAAIGERDVLKPDVEVCVSVPLRAEAASRAFARNRASRLWRLDAIGLTTTIPSTISIPAHCSSDQDSYSSTVICSCIQAGAIISAVMKHLPDIVLRARSRWIQRTVRRPPGMLISLTPLPVGRRPVLLSAAGVCLGARRSAEPVVAALTMAAAGGDASGAAVHPEGEHAQWMPRAFCSAPRRMRQDAGAGISCRGLRSTALDRSTLRADRDLGRVDARGAGRIGEHRTTR
jgi:hypothetical protein